jgi:pyruvate kinase
MTKTLMMRRVVGMTTTNVVGRRMSATGSVVATSTTWMPKDCDRRSIVTTTFQLPDPAKSVEQQYSLTKIVATIGPTSEQAEPLQRVTAAGMKIMRLNFSHATPEEVELRCTNLATAEVRKEYSPTRGSVVGIWYHTIHTSLSLSVLGVSLSHNTRRSWVSLFFLSLSHSFSLYHPQHALSPSTASRIQTTRAILLDTKGPEIRSGKLAHDDTGHATITLQAGHTITLQTNAIPYATQSTTENLYIDYPALATAVQPGGTVLLDDGAIVLTVQSVHPTQGGTVVCRIDNTGELRSRAGVNLPLADTSDLPALSDKDKADIAYGLTKGIDIVAASFVQTAQGVRDIKTYIAQAAAQIPHWEGPLPLVVSKIETASALQHFDEILHESDGIMVARGDLGVEIPLTQVCNAQKEMVHACNAAGKPVRFVYIIL